MTHIDNIREIVDNTTDLEVRTWKDGYLKACKQFDKEVEALKKHLRDWKSEDSTTEIMIDRIFTHKEAIKEAEK